MDSEELQTGVDMVLFSVRVSPADSAQLELFCCLYKSKEGRYSAFSPYLQLEQQKGAYKVLFVANKQLHEKEILLNFRLKKSRQGTEMLQTVAPQVTQSATKLLPCYSVG